MRLARHISLLIAVMLSVSAWAQQKDKQEPKDTYVPRKSDRLFIEPVLNNWLEVPDGIEVRTYSLGFDISYLWDIRFGTSNFSFAPGVGFSSHNVHHNGQFLEVDSAGSSFTDLQPFPSSYSYKKNKLSMNYLEVPLELRFRTNGYNPFRLTAGFKIGVLVDAHTKTKDDDGTHKFKPLPNTLPYRYGVFGRIGYSWFNIVGFYSLTNVFEDGKGVELTPISLGISITPF